MRATILFISLLLKCSGAMAEYSLESYINSRCGSLDYWLTDNPKERAALLISLEEELWSDLYKEVDRVSKDYPAMVDSKMIQNHLDVITQIRTLNRDVFYRTKLYQVMCTGKWAE